MTVEKTERVLDLKNFFAKEDGVLLTQSPERRKEVQTSIHNFKIKQNYIDEPVAAEGDHVADEYNSGRQMAKQTNFKKPRTMIPQKPLDNVQNHTIGRRKSYSVAFNPKLTMVKA